MASPTSAGFEHGSPAEASDALLPHIRPVQTEDGSCFTAAGRVLAAALHTDRPSPPADVSAMDGFALRCADAALGRLPIAGEVRIGRAPPPLPPAACLRIVTGGGVPTGADVVIRREDISESGGEVRLDAAAASRLSPGHNIRRQGENAPPGALVAEAGSLVTPAVSSALAAFGAGRVRVFRPLSVAILTTGDELTEVAATPSPWQIRDSNGPALLSLFTGCPWISDIRPVHIPDEPELLDRELRAALGWADAILITGGVSAGHRDHVPAALTAQGVRTIFHRVPQRPGMPVLGAATPDGRPVFGLPGNPLSVMVTARRMAWPALARRAGVSRVAAPAAVTIANPDARTIPLWWHRSVRLDQPGRAELIDSRGSGDLVSAAHADGFVEIPPGAAGPGPWPFFAWRP
ncbi:MAG: molybdopterin molybdotransferase MoeA [Phycisphaerales bacterium]|nr:molybdopterin molybdotransferase MoeA [Phycisphaerales bacterium]